MKILLTLIVFFASLNQTFAQNKLSKSKESGYYTYIYKITDKETAQIAEKGKLGFNESFLHTQIDSFYTAKGYKKILPFGNYIYLSAYKNALNYHYHSEKNIDLQFINNLKEFQFYLTDKKGNQIQADKVEIAHSKTVNFDSKVQLYKTSFPKRETYIKITYQGVSNFFTFNLDENKPYNYKQNWSFFRKLAYSSPIKYTWQPFKKLFSKKYKPGKQKYKGFMVFSKPKYKPLDTVKFKAYLLTSKGKVISNKSLLVKLNGSKDIVLTNLKPYKDGGYEYQFVLADSLNLRLDRSYQISLAEKIIGEDETLISNSFYYEDYELKSLNFVVRSDKNKHQIGSPITVFMKASDENELAVPDGRVKITALTTNVSLFGDKKVFVPDTLWKKEMNLDAVGETELILPDSIFPKADFNFYLNFEFRNSNNENRSASKYLSFAYQKEVKPLAEIISSLKKDSIYFDYRVNDKSERRNATIISYSKEDVQLDSIQVELPFALKLDYRADNYKVVTDNGLKDYISQEDFSPKLTVNAMQGRDSLRVLIDNENKVPFWYTIFSGNKVFYKGFTNALDTIFRHTNSKAAHIRINYYWADKEFNQEVSAFYNPNLLNVKLLAPDMVYPGQNVNMLVKVTDLENKPVANTDLTAFAITSKFRNDHLPSIPTFGKSYFARKKKNIELESENIYLSDSKNLDWQKWGKKLGLDTIEYYKFTHPKPVYISQETVNDTIAQIAPFLISNGAILPVDIVYIDEVPVFFSQAEQLSRYSFKVKPGKHHLRLRSANKMVTISGFEVPKGKKTIVSIVADGKVESSLFYTYNPVVVDVPNVLTTQESELLNNYMLRIKNNFDGEKTLVKADTNMYLLNPPPNVFNSKDLIVGPLKENYLEFKTKDFSQDFIKEPGYTYTFTKGLIKQKSYESKYAFRPSLTSGTGINVDYKQYALKKNEIDSIWNEYLNLRSHTTPLFQNQNPNSANTGKLRFELDTAFTNRLPYIKNIIIYKPDEPDFIKIYPGNTSYWPPFAVGNYKIMFLLKDNRYFTAEDIIVKPRGVNYYKWNNLKVSTADDFSIKLDKYIKEVKNSNNYYSSTRISSEVMDTFNDKNFDFSTLTGVMKGRVISGEDKSAIPGVLIKIVGLNVSTTTDINGNFSIKIPSKGKISIAYIGYETVTMSAREGNIGDVRMAERHNALEEVVVVGYGTTKKVSMTASSTVLMEQTLSGKAAGLSFNNDAMVRIRGTASLPSTEKPIIIVDGVPFSGDMSTLAPDDIANIDVLKAADATAIYGSRGANGVIIIKTKKGNSAVNTAGELVAQQQTMRTNFSDEGFWQPKLITDETGTAKFSVKFPDDITNWKTKVIAINGRKQSGVTETFIKSFKSLSANFVSPLFATQGDSINVIGKLMNYTPSEENVNRKFSFNGVELRNSRIKFKNAHIDTITIAANGKDSLNFEYTLKQDNGYFDGEIRKIPVFEQGVKETKGYFSALLRDTTITYGFDKNLGKITLRAESSIFPTLLDEMTKLRDYEYLCNEQLASKLKSLLLEKQVRKYLNQPFTHEKDILFVIKKLQQTRKPEGTWAWWQNGEEQIWISLHVVDALLKAEKQGYKIDLNKQTLYNYLVKKLADGYHNEQIETIKLLHLLDDKYHIKDWVLAYEKKKLEEKRSQSGVNSSLKQIASSLSLFESLQLMELKQMAGIKVNTDSLLKIKKLTMFGNLYWGEENTRFWNNSIQNTLMAYKVLRSQGKHQDELEKIALYFLEQRKDGQWRNTYESSLILETILPELLVENKNAEPASLKLNEETVTTFPYDKVLENTANIKLIKNGKMPVYFTAFQQFQNPKPEKVSKDFTINTAFIQNGVSVAKLKAGTIATLKVEVNVRADAEYVMIEIPIPAGCSYENKKQSFWGVETHREYFKNKTSIFCSKLKQGKYTFDIDLMPRYSGSYILNPAKAEMMYFPVFYGREGMKKVGIN
ncbi:alpha-2-macroglobulin family protein [Pedobacter sp.]|uniref:alpha-2-macroglobulin family protein n=1 Tax=Pedobacter sp. TaxID=1411316 RepID=UPI003BAB5819